MSWAAKLGMILGKVAFVVCCLVVVAIVIMILGYICHVVVRLFMSGWDWPRNSA